MDNSTGMSRLAGRAGSLLSFVGIIAFFLGIFGAPRSLAFAGLAMIVLGLVAYSVEEFGPRR